MKRTVFLLLFFLFALLTAAAQAGLAVNAFFDGRYRQRSDAVEVLIRNKRLNRVTLQVFRSLTVPGEGAEGRAIEAAVLADAALAAEKETGYRAGRLYYGFFRLPRAGKKGASRFIFFRNDALRPGSPPSLTLIYMESAASMEDMRRTFAR